MKKFWQNVAHDIGIDLGTANTLVYLRGGGVVINEPSVVAINKRSKEVLAIGTKAKAMIGKVPAEIMVSRPLVDGVVSDFEVTEQMLRYFIGKAQNQRFAPWQRPRVVIGIPSGVTEVEQRAVESATKSAGARTTYLIEEPMAAAIGCRLDVLSAGGNMVVDIGGGTTEVAVISLGGIVVSRSLRLAGDELNETVIQFIRDEFKLQIGEATAEKVKIAIGSAYPTKKEKTMQVRGRDLIKGLPKQIEVSSDQLRGALAKQIRQLVEAIKTTLEETPPELVADIMKKGIMLTGGGALLQGLDRLIKHETNIKVQLAVEPLASVVQGTGLVLEDMEQYKQVLVSTEFKRPVKS